MWGTPTLPILGLPRPPAWGTPFPPNPRFIWATRHVHLLIGEPQRGNPSLVMQVLKQRVARRLLRHRRGRGQSQLWPEPPQAHFWQRRFYDFNVWSKRKRIEKLRYMHRNPVTRRLVSWPELWRWSSFRHYAYGEAGPVKLNEWPARNAATLPTRAS